MNALDQIINACLKNESWDQQEHAWCSKLKHNYAHVSGDLESLKSLPGFRLASSMKESLQCINGVVMAIGDICVERSEGLRDRYLIPAQRAQEYYSLGATLEIDFAERFFPQLKRVIQYLADALALPEGSLGKTILYFSPQGAGFPAHFDAYYNFVFQMAGTKTWRLLENRQVTLPTVHYNLHEYPHMPDQLRSYWQGEAPQDYYAMSCTEVLVPGSMLYLPRGVWHQTEAGELSVSLNITYSIPTVLDVLLAHIKQFLVKHAVMRENVEVALSSEAQICLDQLSFQLESWSKKKWRLYPTEEINAYAVANKAFHSIAEFMHI